MGKIIFLDICKFLFSQLLLYSSGNNTNVDISVSNLSFLNDGISYTLSMYFFIRESTYLLTWKNLYFLFHDLTHFLDLSISSIECFSFIYLNPTLLAFGTVLDSASTICAWIKYFTFSSIIRQLIEFDMKLKHYKPF